MDDEFLDIRQLEAFIAVISTGSMTAAARLLGRSQPVVTRLIQDLEGDVGFPLLQRSGPRIAPSAQGLQFHDEAVRILASLQQLRARAGAIRRAEPAPLEIAAIPAAAAGLLPPAMAALGEALPKNILLQALPAEQVARAVSERRAELGVLSLPVENAAVETHWIGAAPCVAVLRADDPLAALPTLPAAALAGQRVLTLAHPLRLRRRVFALLQEAGAQPAATMAMNAAVNALTAVRAGLGIAVVEPMTGYGIPMEGIVARPLDVSIPFVWAVITPLGQALTPAAEALVASLRSAAQRMLPHLQFCDPADREAVAALLYGAQEKGAAA